MPQTATGERWPETPLQFPADGSEDGSCPGQALPLVILPGTAAGIGSGIHPLPLALGQVGGPFCPSAAPTSRPSPGNWKPGPGRATVTRRLCTIAGFYGYAVKLGTVYLLPIIGSPPGRGPARAGPLQRVFPGRRVPGGPDAGLRAARPPTARHMSVGGILPAAGWPALVAARAGRAARRATCDAPPAGNDPDGYVVSVSSRQLFRQHQPQPAGACARSVLKDMRVNRGGGGFVELFVMVPGAAPGARCHA